MNSPRLSQKVTHGQTVMLQSSTVPSGQVVPMLGGSVALHTPLQVIVPPQLPQLVPTFSGSATLHTPLQLIVPPQEPQEAPRSLGSGLLH
jgi:hypothetical protein